MQDRAVGTPFFTSRVGMDATVAAVLGNISGTWERICARCGQTEQKPIPTGDVYVCGGKLFNQHPWGPLLLFDPDKGVPSPVNRTTYIETHCDPPKVRRCWRCGDPAEARFCSRCSSLTASQIHLQAPGPATGCIWCGAKTRGLVCVRCERLPDQDLVATTF